MAAAASRPGRKQQQQQRRLLLLMVAGAVLSAASAFVFAPSPIARRAAGTAPAWHGGELVGERMSE